MDMLANYLRVAVRNLFRNRGNTLINLFGLGAALLCAIVVFVYVRQQLTFDRFHPHSDQIYRLTFEEINRPGARHFATTSPPMGPELVRALPGIEQAVRFRFTDSNILEYEDRSYYEYQVAYADSGILDMFAFPLARGNPETALSATRSIVLTAEMAGKYFGEEDPLGKTMTLDNRIPLTVTGVFEPLPTNTHLDFDCIISFDTFEVPAGYPVTLDSWGWVSFYTYVRLAPSAAPEDLEARFPELLVNHMGAEVGANRLLHLQPLEEIYLEPDLLNAGVDLRTGNRGYLWGISSVAFFLLVIACFNYMNLSTAQALRRAREVGIRKTLGAVRGGIVRQFLGETLLLSLVSVLLALLLLEPVLDWISVYLGLQLDLRPGDYAWLLPVSLGGAMVIGLAAGTYPAIFLSRYRPAEVLKGEPGTEGRLDLRKVLVAVQFTIAILLIAGSLVIREQIRFIQQKDLGFREEQVLALHMDGTELTSRFRTIRDRLLQHPGVAEVSMGSGLLDGRNGSVPIYPAGGEDPEGYPMNIYGVYFNFFETLDIPIALGRSFSESFAGDSAGGIVINRTAAQVLGLEDPLGLELRVGDIMEGRIIGVAEDFHFASLHRRIQPLVMYIPPTNMEKLFVRLAPGNTAQALASLQQAWGDIVPDFPLQFVFLDEHLNRLYQEDRHFLRLVTAFTLLTILVACLGLYGLIQYFVRRRAREIGIRKILGATTGDITLMLSRRFLTLVALANLVAWPLAWYLADRWLANFAYRVNPDPWTLVAAGGSALLLAWLTISYHTLRAARANPVESLRSE